MTITNERLAELIERTGDGALLHLMDEADVNAALRELTAARAAREDMQRHLDGYRKWQDGLVDQANDAARYRYLRNNDLGGPERLVIAETAGVGDFRHDVNCFYGGGEADAAIDAAMESPPPSREET